MKGKKFGKLLVLEYAGKERRRKTMWKCRCDCGNTVIVEGSHLRSGHTKSCGCVGRDRISKLNYKNGLSQTRLRYTYNNMKNRCTRQNNYEYKQYGQRGIDICKEWLGYSGFVNFCDWALANGYEEGLTIDRIDNDKGYSPENCRWVNGYIQGNNKRNNRFIKINGEIGTVANMSRKYGLDYWNLIHYSNGGKNFRYPDLEIEVASDAEIQKYRKSEKYRA